MAIGFKVRRYNLSMEALGKPVIEYGSSSRSKRKGLNPWLDPPLFFKSFIPLFFLGAVASTIPSVLGSVDEIPKERALVERQKSCSGTVP